MLSKANSKVTKQADLCPSSPAKFPMASSDTTLNNESYAEQHHLTSHAPQLTHFSAIY